MSFHQKLERDVHQHLYFPHHKGQRDVHHQIIQLLLDQEEKIEFVKKEILEKINID